MTEEQRCRREDRDAYFIIAVLLLIIAVSFRACGWDQLARSVLRWGVALMFLIELVRYLA